MITKFHAFLYWIGQLVFMIAFMKIALDIFPRHMRKIILRIRGLLSQIQHALINVGRENRNIPVVKRGIVSLSAMAMEYGSLPLEQPADQTRIVLRGLFFSLSMISGKTVFIKTAKWGPFLKNDVSPTVISSMR